MESNHFKNSQANGIIERVHGVINDMLRTNDLDNYSFDSIKQCCSGIDENGVRGSSETRTLKFLWHTSFLIAL